MKSCLLFILFFLQGLFTFAGSDRVADSLRRIISSTNSDTLKVLALLQLSSYQTHQAEYTPALQSAQEALRLSQQTAYTLGIAKSYNCIGMTYDFQANYPLALIQYRQALNYFQASNNLKGIANSYNNIGLMYYFQGNFPQALHYYSLSIKHKTTLNDQKGLANSYNNVGIIYEKLKDYDQALTYYKSSYQIKTKIGNRKGMANTLHNIGIIYFMKRQFHPAMDFFRQSLQMDEENKDPYSKAHSLHSIGNVYEVQEKYDSALYYYQTGLAIALQLNDKLNQSSLRMNIGKSYLKLHLPQVAKTEALKSFQLAQEIGNVEYLKVSLLYLSQIDSALGNYQSAYQYYKLHTQYKDSLFNEDKAKEFGRIESQYQFEKEAEAQKRKSEQARLKTQAETDRRNSLQYLLIFSGIIGLFAVMMVLGRFRFSSRLMDVSLFAGLLLLFEFLLILCDPILDDFTGGIPIQKLAFNSLLALGFAPLHRFLENLMRKRLGKSA